MPPSSPPDQGSIRPPHPLAERLVARAAHATAPVLEVGIGSGRNRRALVAAGIAYDGIDDAVAALGLAALDGPYEAALSTHALLHGTPEQIGAWLAHIAAHLRPGGMLYATFGSTRDARFGSGARVGDATFAPIDGDERGVAHTYFTRESLRELLAPHYAVERMEEIAVDDIAGRWAHRTSPLRGAVHWFVEASVLTQ